MLSALDYDFYTHGGRPSVLLDVELPGCRDDSFCKSTVYVPVKDKVYTPSSPLSHATESTFYFEKFSK